ncbi:MAG: hypothetical protein GEU75_15190 [Dehalococcoidia bacterium]|nr:hypothetical protein [Dehalococcoidia bacterium]
MHLGWVSFVGATLLLTVACSTSNNGDSPGATSTQPPGVTPNVQITLPPGSPTQPAGSASDEPVAFQTADGVTLRGHLYAPAGAKRKVLVLASTQPQSTWKPYAAEFAGQGIALLTFDPRGVGETGGARNDAMNDDDFVLAIGFIKSRDYPQVYVMGIGSPVAGAAFTAASVSQVAGVIASPAGANTAQEFMRITAPKLYITNEGDATSEANSKLAVQVGPGAGVTVTILDPPHSSPDILGNPDARQAILDFISK